MKINLTFAVLAVFLFSCSAARRNVRANRLSAEITSQFEQHEAIHSHTVTFNRDSSVTETTVHLVPKGPFTFSPTTGFSGEAKSLRIVGKTARLSEERKQEQVQQQSSIDAKSKGAVRQVGRTNVTQRVSFVWIGISVLVLLVLWLLYRFRRKL